MYGQSRKRQNSRNLGFHGILSDELKSSVMSLTLSTSYIPRVRIPDTSRMFALENIKCNDILENKMGKGES